MTACPSTMSKVAGFIRILPPRGLLAVGCGFLMQLCIGSVYSYGNLTTYTTSYLHVRLGENVDYSQAMWIGTLLGLSEGLMFLPGSIMYRRFGARVTILTGGIFNTGFIMLTAFAVKTSLAWVIVTYGVGNGIGGGLLYMVPILVGCRWFPDNKGLVSGVIVGGYGLSGILLTLLQTNFINPRNISTEDDGFFHDDDLLDRVPKLFFAQAVITAVLQVIGFLGIQNPPGLQTKKTVNDGSEPSRPKNASSDEQSRNADHQEINHAPQSEPVVMRDACSSPSKEVNIQADRPSEDTNKSHGDSADISAYTLGESFRTLELYQLLLGFVLNSFSIVIMNPLWKVFGQTFIKNDHFLELVGSGSSLFNMFSRFFWGVVSDVVGFKPAMTTLSGLFCALLFTLSVTSQANQWMFLLWMWSIYFTCSGTFVVVLMGTAETFGQKNAGEIYGVISIAASCIKPLAAGLSSLLLHRYGYEEVFLMAGAFTSVGFMATLTFRPGRLQRQEV